MSDTPIVVGNLPDGPVTPGIRASMERGIADAIPEGKNGVLLRVSGAQGQGVVFAVAARLDDGWALQGDLTAWGAPGVQGSVTIVKSW